VPSRIVVAALAAFSLAVGVVACSSSKPTTPSALVAPLIITIGAGCSSFSPNPASVQVGQGVEWSNSSGEAGSLYQTNFSTPGILPTIGSFPANGVGSTTTFSQELLGDTIDYEDGNCPSLTGVLHIT
jgi:hypothetical protein